MRHDIVMNWTAIALGLFTRIAHGDDNHKAWLKNELLTWAADASSLIVIDRGEICGSVKVFLLNDRRAWYVVQGVELDEAGAQSLVIANSPDVLTYANETDAVAAFEQILEDG